MKELCKNEANTKTKQDGNSWKDQAMGCRPGNRRFAQEFSRAQYLSLARCYKGKNWETCLLLKWNVLSPRLTSICDLGSQMLVSLGDVCYHPDQRHLQVWGMYLSPKLWVSSSRSWNNRFHHIFLIYESINSH